MDAQVLAVINQITKNPVAKIKRTIKSVSIEGALSILDAIGYGKDTVYMDSHQWKVRDFADESYFPHLQGRMCQETGKFWFWGGPPTKLKWYSGNLKTLLDDRVFCAILELGPNAVANLIGTDE